MLRAGHWCFMACTRCIATTANSFLRLSTGVLPRHRARGSLHREIIGGNKLLRDTFLQARQMAVEPEVAGEGTRERFKLGDVEIEGVSVGGQVRAPIRCLEMQHSYNGTTDEMKKQQLANALMDHKHMHEVPNTNRWTVCGVLQETCIILPKLNCAFDSGRCPQRAVYQEHLCISHCHIDHIGGVAAHVSSR